jgi:hypothetical protein
VYGLICDHDQGWRLPSTTRVDQNAFLLLANIIGEGLLTAEELEQFSQEAQARIKMIQELRDA